MTARQPGIAFVSPATSVAEALPRMDIACFVGFAARGPVHEPVAVDSAEQYQNIFGADLPLVWDAENGEQLYAHLGPAVRAFFANGGRRAWVVRVAEQPRSNRFPVPGLCRVTASGRLLPALLTAATPGCWSDALTVAASFDQVPLALHAATLHDGNLHLDLAARSALLDGDLLRAEWNGTIAFIPYAADEAIAWSDLRWFRPATLPSRARDGFARLYRVGYRHRFPIRASADWSGDRPVLHAELPTDRAPRPGETLKIRLGTAEYWLLVERCEPAIDGSLTIAGRGLRRLVQIPNDWPGAPTSFTRLRLNLHIDAGDANTAVTHLRGLGFCDRQANALTRLTGDTLIWRGASTPGLHFLPLTLDTVPGPSASAVPLAESRLTRDGLKRFGAHLFLDPALVTQSTPQLAEAADRVRFTGTTTRPLRGLHAAFGLEEATLLCIPDAVHRPWQRVPGADYPTPAPSAPTPPPVNTCSEVTERDRHTGESRYLTEGNAGPVSESKRRLDPGVRRGDDLGYQRQEPIGNFSPCLPRKLPPPVLTADPANAQSAVRLSWRGGPALARYILEEAHDPDWRDAVEIYRGAANEYTLRDRLHGDYFYRLRFETLDSYSDWSPGIAVRIDPAAGWKIDEAADYRDTDLLAIQRALIRLAAARGDCLAVLAVPRHYRHEQAVEHVRRLKGYASTVFETNDGESIDVPALNAGEAASWSYAALYHPWLRRFGEDASLPALPPDGPATGLIARRTLARGAWIAPANQTLNGIAALDSVFAPDDAQLAVAINPIVRQGLDFSVLDALTLSDDADTQPINVRRLMSLLRRLAQREGARFVFEPNSDALRRTIDLRFRRWLGSLFARGAFAGDSPQAAYRLRVDRTVNTPQSIDAGQLIIEIGVAPAQPLRFLTIRLVQSGEHFNVAEV